MHNPGFSFNPPPRIPWQKLVAQFLRHIGFGEQNEAEGMLKSTPNLAIASGNLSYVYPGS